MLVREEHVLGNRDALRRRMDSVILENTDDVGLHRQRMVRPGAWSVKDFGASFGRYNRDVIPEPVVVVRQYDSSALPSPSVLFTQAVRVALEAALLFAPRYTRVLKFEWDPTKDRVNRARHGVSFEEAATVFGDRFALSWRDEEHLTGEYRLLTLGYTDRQRLVIVVHTEREDRIRIITARLATALERKLYEG